MLLARTPLAVAVGSTCQHPRLWPRRQRPVRMGWIHAFELNFVCQWMKGRSQKVVGCRISDLCGILCCRVYKLPSIPPYLKIPLGGLRLGWVQHPLAVLHNMACICHEIRRSRRGCRLASWHDHGHGRYEEHIATRKGSVIREIVREVVLKDTALTDNWQALTMVSVCTGSAMMHVRVYQRLQGLSLVQGRSKRKEDDMRKRWSVPTTSCRYFAVHMYIYMYRNIHLNGLVVLFMRYLPLRGWAWLSLHRCITRAHYSHA